MDGTNPKVSFIPKGSLAREESFLERRRPRSAIGFIAGLAVIASVGGYAGLLFWSASLEKNVAAERDGINRIQQKFSDAPQISKAQVFLSRAEIARNLLNRHTVVAPVLTFLSDNTLESILYEKFSFVHDADMITLELSGEAPTYAALAYQGDVLRKKTKELSKFAISNVVLTKFSTVTFTLSLTFMPEYLSYSNNLSRIGNNSLQAGITAISGQSMGTSTISANISPNTATSTTEMEDVAVIPQKTETGAPAPSAEKQSALGSIWSRFKFW